MMPTSLNAVMKADGTPDTDDDGDATKTGGSPDASETAKDGSATTLRSGAGVIAAVLAALALL
jgi:hypothetical protein